MVLVACGGGAPATTGPAAATPTSAQATSTAVATTVPTTATSTATTGSGTVDACSLLTTTEVAAATGEALDTATPSSDSLYAYCNYTGSGSQDVRTFVLTDTGTAASVFGTMKVNDGEGVTGVGDEAWWSTDSFQPGLYIMKNG